TFGVPLASFEDLVAVGQAYIDAGMRAVLAPMLADITLYKAIPGLLEALPARQRDEMARSETAGADVILGAMERALRDWPLDRARVRLGVAPTIPLHCSDDLIVGSTRLAREHGAVLQSHV